MNSEGWIVDDQYLGYRILILKIILDWLLMVQGVQKFDGKISLIMMRGWCC